MTAFQSKEFLPDTVIARLIETRVKDPERPIQAARSRRRRERLTPDGRLNILAADHPARCVTGLGDDPLGMADRQDYLARIARVLSSDAVDGVMATMDVIDDLLILHDLTRPAGGPALLDEKLLIASLNRGGLAGAAWEMDDPMTGANPESCMAYGLDGVKILLRLCDDEPSSLRTLVAASKAINETNALKLPLFLEPLPVTRAADGYKVVKTAEALARTVGVASALGDSSRYMWLKLPYCEDFEVVARATMLPILLLGGEATGDPTALLREIAAGLAAGGNVRGAMAGRNMLYPGLEDPLVVAEAVGGIIHLRWKIEHALDAVAAASGQDL